MWVFFHSGKAISFRLESFSVPNLPPIFHVVLFLLVLIQSGVSCDNRRNEDVSDIWEKYFRVERRLIEHFIPLFEMASSIGMKCDGHYCAHD